MTKTQFRLGALLILAAILLHNLTSPDRYSAHGTGVAMVKIDRITGKTWLFKTALPVPATGRSVKVWEAIPHK
jgi:hypothetical protein